MDMLGFETAEEGVGKMAKREREGSEDWGWRTTGDVVGCLIGVQLCAAISAVMVVTSHFQFCARRSTPGADR